MRLPMRQLYSHFSEMGSYWTPAETMGKEIVQGDVTEANAEKKTKEMVKGILSNGL